MRITRQLFTLFICTSATLVTAQDAAELVVSTGHTENINSLDFSNDGRYLASGSADQLVKIYDIEMMSEFRTLVGHNGRLERVMFTDDDAYLVTCGYDGIMIWSHPDGKLLHKLEYDVYGRGSCDVTPDNKLLVAYNSLKVIDIATGTVEAEWEDIDGSATASINDGSLVAGQTWNDGAVPAIFDRATGEIVTQLEIPSGASFIGCSRFEQSPDGKLIASEVNGLGYVAVWDVATGALQTEFQIGISMLGGFGFTPNSKQVVTTGFDNILRYNDAKSGKVDEEISQFHPGVDDPTQAWYYSAPDVAFSKDGEIMAIPYQLGGVEGAENFIRLYDSKKFKSIGAFTGQRKYISQLMVDHTGEFLLASVYGTVNGTRVWNIKDGELQRYYGPSGLSVMNETMFSRWVYDVNTMSPAIQFLELPSFDSLSTMKIGSGAVSDISGDNRYYAGMEMDPDYDIYSGTMPDMFIDIYDTENGELIYQEQYDILDAPQKLRFSLDNTKLYVIYQYKITTVELPSGKASTVEGFESLNAFYQFDNHPDGKHLVFTENTNYELGCRAYIVDPSDPAACTYFETGEWALNNSVKYSPDGNFLAMGMRVFDAERIFQVWVYDVNSGERVCTMEGHTMDVMQLAWSPDGKSLFSADNSGVIKMWNMEECTSVVSFIAMNDLDYIIVTPDNYYKSSKGNFDGVGFRYHNKLYGFDQFDLTFNRPDLVMEQIGYTSPFMIKMYKLAYDKRLKRMGFTEDMLSDEFHVPEIEVTNLAEIPLNTKEESITVHVSAHDDQIELNRLNVYINDVPAFGTNGIAIGGGKAYEDDLQLKLASGTNKVQISVLNSNGAESVRETFTILCDKGEPKPDLYMLAVGVSEYVDADHNLTFPTKDVNDLVTVLEKSGEYGNIIVKKVLDADATRDNIITTSAFFKDAGVDDHVMVYYSSHGLLDENLDYFLATHDVDFENPAGLGLPYEEIDKMLDGTDARNRLVMIDACHSGEVDKDEAVESQVVESGVSINFKGSTMIKPKAGLENSFAYMQALFTDVSKGTGATVISAAGGYEFALESAEWNNGVFTYSVMDGLTSGKADMDQSGSVSISELRNYIIERVHELTNGAQTPTARKVNELNNFTIY